MPDCQNKGMPGQAERRPAGRQRVERQRAGSRHGLLLALMVSLLMPHLALAHKVLASAYVIDSDARSATIEGEIGLSDGTMAAAGIPVQVFAANGELLGETNTLDGGLFTYRTTQGGDLRFTANLSAGHITHFILPADELPDQLKGVHGSNPQAQAATSLSPSTDDTIDPTRLQHLINKAVADQIRPLRKDLARFKEEVRWHDVLGGIGYILGLFGIAAWVQSRRKERS